MFRRLYRGDQCGDCSVRGSWIFAHEELAEPRQVGDRRRRDGEFHTLRGLGRGSPFGLPQLRIQA